MIVIGYSMPQADGLVRTLLSTDLPAHVEDVIVVEPNVETQAGHIELFTRRARAARVFAFSTFREFYGVLGA